MLISIPEQETINRLLSDGYQKAYTWDAAPGELDPEHQHDFDTKLVILSGEICISGVVYKAGDEIVIPHHQLHEAKAGSSGCRYIVGEKR